ncbi:hypothetical protein [Iodidimonas sp. SYSU 1G8]|uniref:hypothetical protein n=1 Tax=Iodidimonas sp. SYSU 1G8 TaxID=3133967 RepID=UPI0031FE9F20
MKPQGTILLIAAMAGLSGCGVVYKPEVIISGCISSARTADDVLREAVVDAHGWGPGQATIDFIPDTGGDKKMVVAECTVDGAGELDRLRIAGTKVEGEKLEAARKAFRDIATSPAWANK